MQSLKGLALGEGIGSQPEQWVSRKIETQQRWISIDGFNLLDLILADFKGLKLEQLLGTTLNTRVADQVVVQAKNLQSLAILQVLYLVDLVSIETELRQVGKVYILYLFDFVITKVELC